MPHVSETRAEWIEKRIELLAEEKALTRARDDLARKRRGLPWLKIEKNYRFETPNGPLSLADLFAGRSQLFVKHFMLGPGQETQCVGCSLEVDHVGGILPHLEACDVSYVAIARAPIDEIERMRKRMGWTFRWASSFGSDFNYDMGVSFHSADVAAGRATYNYRPYDASFEDLSGDSVFVRDESGHVYLTYQSFGRGGEEFLGFYRFLDAVPKGRPENGPFNSLADWARPHNAYAEQGEVEASGRYHAPACACSRHAGAPA